MGSAISTARQALHVLLAAAGATGSGHALEGVQITFGDPLAHEKQELVSLQGVLQPVEDWAALGGQKRDEQFGIEVTVKAYNPAGTAAAVDARGFALAEGVRTVVNANRQLSNSVLWCAVTAQETDGAEPVLDPTGAQQGWVIILALTVGCRARVV